MSQTLIQLLLKIKKIELLLSQSTSMQEQYLALEKSYRTFIKLNKQLLQQENAIEAEHKRLHITLDVYLSLFIDIIDNNFKAPLTPSAIPSSLSITNSWHNKLANVIQSIKAAIALHHPEINTTTADELDLLLQVKFLDFYKSSLDSMLREKNIQPKIIERLNSSLNKICPTLDPENPVHDLEILIVSLMKITSSKTIDEASDNSEVLESIILQAIQLIDVTKARLYDKTPLFSIVKVAEIYTPFHLLAELVGLHQHFSNFDLLSTSTQKYQALRAGYSKVIDLQRKLNILGDLHFKDQNEPSNLIKTIRSLLFELPELPSICKTDIDLAVDQNNNIKTTIDRLSGIIADCLSDIASFDSNVLEGVCKLQQGLKAPNIKDFLNPSIVASHPYYQNHRFYNETSLPHEKPIVCQLTRVPYSFNDFQQQTQDNFLDSQASLARLLPGFGISISSDSTQDQITALDQYLSSKHIPEDAITAYRKTLLNLLLDNKSGLFKQLMTFISRAVEAQQDMTCSATFELNYNPDKNCCNLQCNGKFFEDDLNDMHHHIVLNMEITPEDYHIEILKLYLQDVKLHNELNVVDQILPFQATLEAESNIKNVRETILLALKPEAPYRLRAYAFPLLDQATAAMFNEATASQAVTNIRTAIFTPGGEAWRQQLIVQLSHNSFDTIRTPFIIDDIRKGGSQTINYLKQQVTANKSLKETAYKSSSTQQGVAIRDESLAARISNALTALTSDESKHIALAAKAMESYAASSDTNTYRNILLNIARSFFHNPKIYSLTPQALIALINHFNKISYTNHNEIKSIRTILQSLVLQLSASDQRALLYDIIRTNSLGMSLITSFHDHDETLITLIAPIMIEAYMARESSIEPPAVNFFSRIDNSKILFQHHLRNHLRQWVLTHDISDNIEAVNSLVEALGWPSRSNNASASQSHFTIELLYQFKDATDENREIIKNNIVALISHQNFSQIISSIDQLPEAVKESYVSIALPTLLTQSEAMALLDRPQLMNRLNSLFKDTLYPMVALYQTVDPVQREFINKKILAVINPIDGKNLFSFWKKHLIENKLQLSEILIDCLPFFFAYKNNGDFVQEFANFIFNLLNSSKDHEVILARDLLTHAISDDNDQPFLRALLTTYLDKEIESSRKNADKTLLLVNTILDIAEEKVNKLHPDYKEKRKAWLGDQMRNHEMTMLQRRTAEKHILKYKTPNLEPLFESTSCIDSEIFTKESRGILAYFPDSEFFKTYPEYQGHQIFKPILAVFIALGEERFATTEELLLRRKLIQRSNHNTGQKGLDLRIYLGIFLRSICFLSNHPAMENNFKCNNAIKLSIQGDEVYTASLKLEDMHLADWVLIQKFYPNKTRLDTARQAKPSKNTSVLKQKAIRCRIETDQSNAAVAFHTFLMFIKAANDNKQELLNTIALHNGKGLKANSDFCHDLFNQLMKPLLLSCYQYYFLYTKSRSMTFHEFAHTILSEDKTSQRLFTDVFSDLTSEEINRIESQCKASHDEVRRFMQLSNASQNATSTIFSDFNDSDHSDEETLPAHHLDDSVSILSGDHMPNHPAYANVPK